jgi:hypothetical protein
MFLVLLVSSIKKFKAARMMSTTGGAAASTQGTRTLVNSNSLKSDEDRKNTTPGGRNIHDL